MDVAKEEAWLTSMKSKVVALAEFNGCSEFICPSSQKGMADIAKVVAQTKRECTSISGQLHAKSKSHAFKKLAPEWMCSSLHSAKDQVD